MKAKPANEIITTTGGVYNNVYVEKKEKDGIIISYTPARGGMAIVKIYSYELPDSLQLKYGFASEKSDADGNK